MSSKKESNLNVSERGELDNSSEKGKPFLKENDLTEITPLFNKPNQRIDRRRILDLIETACLKHGYISLPTLVRISGKGRTTINTIIESFEFSKLISTKLILNNQHRAEKIITIDEKKMEEKKNENN